MSITPEQKVQLAVGHLQTAAAILSSLGSSGGSLAKMASSLERLTRTVYSIDLGQTAEEYGYRDGDYSTEFIAGFEEALDVISRQLS